jgi:hypothetical protein
MLSWDVSNTRKLIAEVFGDEQVELIRESLNSLAERQVYASFHFHEYTAILRHHIDAKLGEKHILELTFPFAMESTFRTDNFMSQAAAHAVACLQSLHCILDTLSFAAYYSLGLNKGASALAPRDITSVRLRNLLTSNRGLQEISDSLMELSENPTLRHLGALVNHSKHRSIIKPVLNVDFRDHTTPYCLKFPAIVYNEVSYPEVDAQEFMEQTYSILSPGVVKCGNAINAALARRLD